MDSHNEMTERGLGIFGELMGTDRADNMREHIHGERFGSSMARLAADFAFASVWARGGLERKQRSLVVIGVLIAQRQLEELQNHVRIGLRNGLTPQEIEEALLQTAPYVGLPAAGSAMKAIQDVFQEQGVMDGRANRTDSFGR